MLSFVKTGAAGNSLFFTAADGAETVGTAAITLEDGRIRLSVKADRYPSFVLASAVFAAAKYGLPIDTDDGRFAMYGFTEKDGVYSADPESVVFPSECREGKQRTTRKDTEKERTDRL